MMVFAEMQREIKQRTTGKPWLTGKPSWLRFLLFKQSTLCFGIHADRSLGPFCVEGWGLHLPPMFPGLLLQ